MNLFFARSFWLRLLALLGGLSPVLAQDEPSETLGADSTPKLTLDLERAGVTVSPTLYGLMTEEINHSYDGGLYAELVRNRAFLDDRKQPVHWSPVSSGTAAADIHLDAEHPLNSTLPVSLRLEANAATEADRAGVANAGFWGIPIRPRTEYRASFYAKAEAGFTGAVTVTLESEDGTIVHALARSRPLTSGWQQYSLALSTADLVPTASARLVLSLDRPGTVWFSLVSLFPPTWNQRPNGNRIDLMQLLVDMKPSFLRFPGGNYLQGGTVATRFDWKKTLGDLAQRPGHEGPWGYRSSDGMGQLEFLLWSEDLNAEPIPGVYAGYSLKGELIPAGPRLEPFVQDALDQIEYLIGDTTTTWGRRRAQDGHPSPFKLTYVEIGNEDWLDKSGSYEGRYAQFHDAIKARYPHLKLIATTSVKSREPDLIDEHIYRDAWQMQDEADRYDGYSRSSGPKVFVGEWASRERAATTSLAAALGDAAWMTGLERNSDLVLLSCYAPLFVNLNRGAMRWRSNLIGYDALSSYGSPSYHAQKLFATYLGDTLVPVSGERIPEQTWQRPADRRGIFPPPKQIPALYYCATRDRKTGTIYLKVVNPTPSSLPVTLALKGVSHVAPAGLAVVLSSASPSDTNSLAEPRKVVPVAHPLADLGPEFTHRFPAHSITVLKIETAQASL